MTTEQQNLFPQQQKELDQINWRIQFQQQVVQDLRANSNIQDFFENYNPESVGKFILDYAQQKAQWHQHGEFLVKQKEEDDMKWIEAGFWHLELIQQKKLFDIQCLWRAEQVELPGIELGVDFAYWKENILNCPFVDPITEEEVEMYQDYLETDNIELKEDIAFGFHFQSYDQIKDAFISDDPQFNFPAWYEYYNNRRGTAQLLHLPDVRGEKERFYLQLGRSAEKQQAMAEVYQAIFHRDGGPIVDKDGRKHLFAFQPETIAEFVDQFEDKKTKAYYKAYEWLHRHRDEMDRLEESLELLMDAEEDIPMEEHEYWKEAIHRAARRVEIQKIREHLPEAFEQYRLNLSMNISFPEKDAGYAVAARKELVKDILLGRKRNGEPEDLNF